MNPRRQWLRSSLAAAAMLALAGSPGLTGCASAIIAASARKPRRRIGHTGITWGYSPDNAPQAIRDVAALGYHGFESFGSVLEAWAPRGGLQRLLEEHALPLVGAYCPLVLTDQARLREETSKAVRWGELIRACGGRIAVIGPDNVDRASFDFAAHRADIIAALNVIGGALADIGITAAVHQHTGSCVTTREETWAVMENVDHRRVKLCPDTGELLAAGIDPVEAIRHFGDIIAHVHIKDHDGGARHDGYTPVGHGRVDVRAVMATLEALPADFMVMAELNPDRPANRSDPDTPKHAARASRDAFAALGYSFDPATA